MVRKALFAHPTALLIVLQDILPRSRPHSRRHAISLYCFGFQGLDMLDLICLRCMDKVCYLLAIHQGNWDSTNYNKMS